MEESSVALMNASDVSRDMKMTFNFISYSPNESEVCLQEGKISEFIKIGGEDCLDTFSGI